MNRSTPFIVAAASAVTLFAVPASSVFAAPPAQHLDNDRRVPKVVTNAKIVEEGKGSEDFTLPEEGQVWLVDATTNALPLHSIKLGKGQTYGFDTKKNAVIINGKKGESLDLDSDHTYRIYYVSIADRDREGDVVRDKDRGERDRSARDRSDRDSGKRLVPDSAEIVANGKNEELTYVAKVDGMLYLYDTTDDKLIESFRLQDGDRITVSPKNNVVSVNDKTIKKDIELDKKHKYNLLFDRKKHD